MMPVKSVPTMGWTRSSATLTILAVTEAQKREMGARVAELRDAQGMTNESLARKAKLSVKTVSRFTHGKHEPRGNTIEALSKALGVGEDYIRGAPPAPLGLGATNPAIDQLDRIEQKLDRIMAYLDLEAGSQVTLPDQIAGLFRDQAATRRRPRGSRTPAA